VIERFNKLMKRRRLDNERGFTLIELLVVIVILGILSAVVVFSVSGIGDKGKSSAKNIDGRTLRTAEEAFWAQNGRYGSESELIAGRFLAAESTYNDIALTGSPVPSSAYQIVDAPTAIVNVAAFQDTWPTADSASPGYRISSFAYPLNTNMYDPLIIIGSDYSLQPGLATSWEPIPTSTLRQSFTSANNPTALPLPTPPNGAYTNAPDRPYNTTTWRFHLRQGVKFHDGSDFDADDVMWTWQERQALNGVGQTLNSSLTTVTNNLGFTRNGSSGTLVPDRWDSVEKIDQFTVDFTPKVQNLRLPEQIGHPKGAIMSVGKHFDGSTGGLQANNNAWRAVTTASITSGSNAITGGTPFLVGDVLFGTGIPANTTVTAVGPGANAATMSANATATNGAVSVTMASRAPATAVVAGTPVGTGPFKYASYSTGVSASVDAYEAYWGTRAQVKRMNYTFISDPVVRTQKLQSGEVDLAMDLNPLDVAAVNASGSHVVTASYGQNVLIYVNKVVKYGPGDAPKYDFGTDPAVRQAASLSLDRNAYVAAIYNGNASPGRWMAPPTILGTHSGDVPALSFNRAQARTILDDAGWTCGGGAAGAHTACANENSTTVAPETRVHVAGGTFGGRALNPVLIADDNVSQAGVDLMVSSMKAVGLNVQATRYIVTPSLNQRSVEYNAGDFDFDVEVPNQNDANPAFLPTLRFACSRSGTFRFGPVDGTNGIGPSVAATKGTPAVADGRYPIGNTPCNTGSPNTTPAVLGPFDNSYVPGADNGLTQDAAQAAAAQQMAILVNQNQTNVVIPVAGQFRIYGMRANVNLGDPHPSQTSQRWVSLTKTSST
jgi:prepilin-type N-terminal cleavage/methylation domain-containing protein